MVAYSVPAYWPVVDADKYCTVGPTATGVLLVFLQEDNKVADTINMDNNLKTRMILLFSKVKNKGK